jgi:hypothetical protein
MVTGLTGDEARPWGDRMPCWQGCRLAAAVGLGFEAACTFFSMCCGLTTVLQSRQVRPVPKLMSCRGRHVRSACWLQRDAQ